MVLENPEEMSEESSEILLSTDIELANDAVDKFAERLFLKCRWPDMLMNDNKNEIVELHKLYDLHTRAYYSTEAFIRYVDLATNHDCDDEKKMAFDTVISDYNKVVEEINKTKVKTDAHQYIRAVKFLITKLESGEIV